MASVSALKRTPGFVIKRRLRLLRRLAARAHSRHDINLRLRDVAPALDIVAYADIRFVDKTNPQYSGGSDLSYDFNSLQEEGLLTGCFLEGPPDSYGQCLHDDPAVKLTLKGLKAVADANRWWITKAIEKEPATFLQVVLAVVIAAASWAVGRYLTPVSSEPPGSHMQSHVDAPPMPHASDDD